MDNKLGFRRLLPLMISVHKSETVQCLTMFKQHSCRKDFLGSPDTYRTSLKDGTTWWRRRRKFRGKSGKRTRRSLKRGGKEVVEMLKRRQPALERLCASRARSSNCFDELSFKKKEEKEMEGGAYITGCLLTKPSWLFAPPVQFLFIIIDLTYY